MRKLKKNVFTLLIVTGLVLTSCSNDHSNENTAEESTGDYWPTAVNNQWVLDQNGTESTMKILSSEKVNDDTYFKFNQLTGASSEIEGSASASIKKVKGDYYIKIDQVDYSGEGSTGKITGYEYIFFKDYLKVNETWTGNYTQETSFNIPEFPTVKITVNYTGTILERGATATIKTVTYKDVIKFKLRQEAKTNGQSSIADTEYWIAKDVGVIKMVSGNNVAELVSYIKK
nr:hypothetical protein [uncultured Flavobacterium sp.]